MERKQGKKLQIPKGGRFGKLVAVGPTGRRKYRMIEWEFKCDCGSQVFIPGSFVYRLRGTRQCIKCRNKQFSETVTKLNHEKRKSYDSVIRSKMYRDIQGAKTRNHIWGLTEKEYEQRVKQPCHYCNAPPKLATRLGGRYRSYVNGLDRVDNSLGYIVDNVVPCCEYCNRMKMAHTLNDFLSHVHRIATHQGWIPKESEATE